MTGPAVRRDLLRCIIAVQAPPKHRLGQVEASAKAISLIFLLLVVAANKHPKFPIIVKPGRFVLADNVGHFVHPSGLASLNRVSRIFHDHVVGVDRERGRRPFRSTRSQ